MKRTLSLSACAAICTAALTLAAMPANAGPNAGPNAGLAGATVPTAQGASLIEKVQYRDRAYRGGSYRGGRSGGNFGRNAAIGIGAAIIGGIILSESARSEHRRDHASDWERCAQAYRSFERETGLYTGYDGVRRTCPYLS